MILISRYIHTSKPVAFKRVQALLNLLRWIASSGLWVAFLNGEIFISDDGLLDGSQDIAHNLGARVVDYPIRGYGAALKAAVLMKIRPLSTDCPRIHKWLEVIANCLKKVAFLWE